MGMSALSRMWNTGKATLIRPGLKMDPGPNIPYSKSPSPQFPAIDIINKTQNLETENNQFVIEIQDSENEKKENLELGSHNWPFEHSTKHREPDDEGGVNSDSSNDGDNLKLSTLEKNNIDYPCCTKESKKFYKEHSQLQRRCKQLDIDWEILDRICEAQAIQKEVCETCKTTKNQLYLMISTYGTAGPLKTVLYCICKELQEKYFPLNETLSLNFTSFDTISTIYNFAQKNNKENNYIYGIQEQSTVPGKNTYV